MSDIAELFQRDPEQLTKEDRRAIIEKYREARQQFILGAAQAGSAKKIKATVPKLKELDLDDLDL